MTLLPIIWKLYFCWCSLKLYLSVLHLHHIVDIHTQFVNTVNYYSIAISFSHGLTLNQVWLADYMPSLHLPTIPLHFILFLNCLNRSRRPVKSFSLKKKAKPFLLLENSFHSRKILDPVKYSVFAIKVSSSRNSWLIHDSL